MLTSDLKFVLALLGGIAVASAILLLWLLRSALPAPIHPSPTPIAELRLPTTASRVATGTIAVAAPPVIAGTITGTTIGATETVTRASTGTEMSSIAATSTARTLAGVVRADAGPLPGAIVRVQLTGQSVIAAADGSFTLTTPVTGTTAGQPITVTAWAEGHYIGATVAHPDDEAIQIVLNPHYTTDNVAYDWFEEDGLEGSAACGSCHTAYVEWQQDAHSQTATNYRFLTLYSGTDIDGNESPLTGYTSDGKLAKPDPDQPYHGPGFKLDNPTRAGNCATCHTPIAAKLPTTDGCSWSGCHSSTVAQYSDEIQAGASPRYLYGAAEEGISCEFCHKIGDVRLGEDRLPYGDSPGILSLVLHRPEAGDDLFFGPLDDVLRTDVPEPRDSYLPLQSQSEFCAGCHYGIMGGVVGPRSMTGGVEVYSSYSEWLDSPYSDPATGQTCQDCHMPRVDYDHFVFPEKGGKARDYYQISNHTMLGPDDEDFLRGAVTLTATAAVDDGRLLVDVNVTNSGAGHHLPTGTPLRHLVLLVQAVDANGNPLPHQAGPALPTWAGALAGQPGKVFAKLLRDKSTGETPTAAYWREIELVADTRIPALATDQSRHEFGGIDWPVSGHEVAQVEISLFYRRAYPDVIEQKRWPDQDLLLNALTLPAEEWIVK